MASATASWTCPTCGGAVTTAFCANCGEQPLDPRDLTLRGLFHQVVQVFSNVDSRVLRSFRMLLRHPGLLTISYAQGQRKPYIGPFQIFILANLLFFAVQAMTDFKIISAPLDNHLHRQIWSPYAQTLLAERLEATGKSLELYALEFDRAVSLNAKSLIGLMVLPFALFPLVIFWRAGRPFAVHVVFSLHFYAFLLLLFCVPLAGLMIDQALGGSAMHSQTVDDALAAALLASCAVYLYFAVGKAYGANKLLRLIEAGALAFIVAVIFLAYRFAIFLFTLYTT